MSVLAARQARTINRAKTALISRPVTVRAKGSGIVASRHTANDSTYQFSSDEWEKRVKIRFTGYSADGKAISSADVRNVRGDYGDHLEESTWEKADTGIRAKDIHGYTVILRDCLINEINEGGDASLTFTAGGYTVKLLQNGTLSIGCQTFKLDEWDTKIDSLLTENFGDDPRGDMLAGLWDETVPVLHERWAEMQPATPATEHSVEVAKAE